MKTRPILWAPESVRALLNTRPDGTAIDPAKPFKTETRRLMNPWPAATPGEWSVFDGVWRHTASRDEEWKALAVKGDHLWGREAWVADPAFDNRKPSEFNVGERIQYLADCPDGSVGRYRHARFMCQWMARLHHEVVSVRPERLQELTDQGALAEGCPPELSARDAYSAVWERLHPSAGWEKNPWVWVIRLWRIDG